MLESDEVWYRYRLTSTNGGSNKTPSLKQLTKRETPHTHTHTHLEESRDEREIAREEDPDEGNQAPGGASHSHWRRRRMIHSHHEVVKEDALSNAEHYSTFSPPSLRPTPTPSYSLLPLPAHHPHLTFGIRGVGGH